MRRLRALFNRVRPPRSVLNLAGWAIAGQLIPLAVSPLLTRWYEPAAFGAMATVIAIVSVTLVIAGGKLEVGVTTTPDPADRIDIARTGRTLVIVVSICVGLVAMATLAADWTLFGLSPAIALLIAAATFLGGWLAFDRALLLRAEEYNRIGLRSMLNATSLAIQQVVYGLYSLGTVGLVAGWSLSGVAAFLVPKRQGFIGLAGPREALAGLSKWRTYPLTLVPAGLLNQVGQYLPVFALGFLFGDTILGQYSLVVRILALPAGLVAFSAGQFFFGKASRLRREGSNSLTSLIRSAVLRLFFFGGLPVLFASLSAPLWFPWVYGDVWTQAGVFGLIMAPALVTQITVGPVSTVLITLGRNRDQLNWDIFRVAVLVTATVVASAGSLPAEAVVALFSAALTLTYLDILRRSLAAARLHDAASSPGDSADEAEPGS